MNGSTWKGVITGAAGGLMAWWAIDRFYKLARASSSHHALMPYCVGAGLGAAYGGLVLRREVPPIARVPLGAAVYLADPEHTAAPLPDARDISDKASRMAVRLASRGLKRMVQRTLWP